MLDAKKIQRAIAKATDAKKKDKDDAAWNEVLELLNMLATSVSGQQSSIEANRCAVTYPGQEVRCLRPAGHTDEMHLALINVAWK